MIIIKEALDKKTEKDFYNFPIWLYKNCKHSSPALISEERAEFNPLINGAFEFCIARKFVAYRDGKAVGRIAGIFNQRYNVKKDVKQVRFTRFDTIDDCTVSSALINKITEWARDMGMNEVIGPIGFSDLDKQGMLIEGFEEPNLYITPYNYDYYPKHMEQLGFKKAVDWVEYELKIPDKVDEKLLRLSQAIQKRYGFTFADIKSFKDGEKYIYEALNVVMNEAYEPLFGVTKLNDRQIEREKKVIKQIFNPDFVYIVLKDGAMAGYGFMAPNVTDAMRAFNGRINLRGIFALMRALKKFDTIDLYSIGVKKEYQSKGVNAMIMLKGLEALVKNKVKTVYTGPELEYNVNVQGQWDSFERRINRRRRCYTLSLNSSTNA